MIYLGKNAVYSVAIEEVTLVENGRLSRDLLHSGQRPSSAIGQVVNGNYLVALCEQVNDAVRPNVTSTTRHKHCLGCTHLACKLCLEDLVFFYNDAY